MPLGEYFTQWVDILPMDPHQQAGRVYASGRTVRRGWEELVHKGEDRKVAFYLLHCDLALGGFYLWEFLKPGLHLGMWVCVSHLVVSDSFGPMDCSPPGSSLHGVLQARILERVATPFTRSSRPRDQTQVSHIAGRFFTVWDTLIMPAIL